MLCSRLRRTVRLLCPPLFLQLYECLTGVRYFGNYPDWESAAAECDGYEADLILKTVMSSVEKVLRGEAVFERDSQLFFTEAPEGELLAAVLLAAAGKKELSVIDFGGGLGSSFFQNRRFLEELPSVSWNIVEQRNFVDAGKRLPMPGCVRFYDRLEAALQDRTPDIIIFSCVLPYLPDPWRILRLAREVEPEFIFVGRTLLRYQQDHERIAIQKVPARLYQARYPIRLIGDRQLLKFMDERYRLVSRYGSWAGEIRLNGESGPVRYENMLWRRLPCAKIAAGQLHSRESDDILSQ